MVWDILFDILLKVPTEIINKIPNVVIGDIPIPSYTAEYLHYMLRYLNLFFPVELCSFIITTKLQLKLTRIQFALARYTRSHMGMGG